MFEVMIGKDKHIFMNKNSAKELAFEIDNPAIFEDCTCGEYFNYNGVKVFVNRMHWREYKRLIEST